MLNESALSRFLDLVDSCKTQREMAKTLGVSDTYVYFLTRKFGVLKWRQKNRVHKPVKTVSKICKECGELFIKQITNNPGTFCSRKCLGRYLGKHHGFKKGDQARLQKNSTIIK